MAAVWPPRKDGMMEEWLTLGDVSMQTGIPERTIRRYLDRHSAYLPTKREGRVYRCAAAAVPVIQFIRAQCLTGATETIVQERLDHQFVATVTVPATRSSSAEAPSATDLAVIVQTLTLITEHLQKVTDQNIQLQAQIAHLIDRVMQLQSQIADQPDEKPSHRQSWWQRLWGEGK